MGKRKKLKRCERLGGQNTLRCELHIVTPKLCRAMRTIPVGSERGPEEPWQSRDGGSLNSRGNVRENRGADLLGPGCSPRRPGNATPPSFLGIQTFPHKAWLVVVVWVRGKLVPSEFRTKELEAPGLGPGGTVVDREAG